MAKSKNRGYSFRKKLADRCKTTRETYLEGPSPDEYNPNFSLVFRNNKLTNAFGRDRRNSVDLTERNNPGPGKYNVVKDFLAKTTKFGKDNKELKLVTNTNNFLGPGKYDPQETSKQNTNKTFSFGKDDRLKGIRTANPSPSKYNGHKD